MPDPGTSSTPPDRLNWAAVTGYFPGLRPGNYIRPLPDLNLLYVKNPKAACSTLMLWLHRMHTGDHEFVAPNIHQDNRLPKIVDVGRRRVVRMLSGGAYRFSFVRHPVHRLESVYWNKVVYEDKWRLKTSAIFGFDPDHPFSFEEFLEAVEQQDPVSEMDPHWRPQHINLLHPIVSYDFIGRLENFDADLARVREEAQLPTVPFEVRNKSMHTSRESVYDGRPDLVRRVEELYTTDMELYGY